MATGSDATAEKRLLLRRLAEVRDAASGGPRRRAIQWTVAALAVVAILTLLGLWALGFFSTPGPVLEFRALVDRQIDHLRRVARNEAPLTFESMGGRQAWERMREMPRELRGQVRGDIERLMRARDQAEVLSYFSLPPQERLQELDRRIQEQEARRRAAQQDRANRSRSGPGTPGGAGQGSGRGGPGGVPGGGPGPGQAAAARAAGGQPAGATPGGRGRTEEARNARRKERIDQSSPAERAQSAEYRRALEARRQQLGLGPGRGRGG